MEDCRRVFWMELSAYVPAFSRDLYYFNQISIRIYTNTLHTLGLILILICVIELIAMAMTLFYTLNIDH